METFKATLSIDGTIIRKNFTMPENCNQNVIQKSKFLQKNPNTLLNKVFIFSVILLYLAKYFCKHEMLLQYITVNMKV